MSTGLSPQSAEFIRLVVASGAYQSEQQALDAAVQLLKARERLKQDLLVAMADSARGDVIPADLAFERIQKRAAEIEAAATSSAREFEYEYQPKP